MIKRAALFVSLSVLLLVVALLSGAEWIAPSQMFASENWLVIETFRLPRILLVFLIGAVLALIGTVYQSILNNPLADPYILGTSSASALGVVIAGIWLCPMESLLAKGIGLITTGLLTCILLVMNNRNKGRTPDRLVLFGFAANLVLSSFLFVLLSIHADTLGGGSMRWLFGRVPWLSLREVLGFGAILILFSIPLFAIANGLNAISLGDGVCRSLGFNPQRIRVIALASSSVLISVMVSIAGSIGFVGLIVPHFAREVFAASLGKRALLIQFTIGGLFLVVADTLSRSIHPPLEIPIGIVTTLLGGPIFLLLMWRRSANH